MERRVDMRRIPKYVLTVLDILLDNGFEAYIVGGSVRDLLLGLTPSDYDVATDLDPSGVIRVFSSRGYKVIPTGIEYGTVTVVVDSSPVEVTTYRKELYLHDKGRKPVVEYASDLYTDVWRRDFTINALAVDRNGYVIDYVGGLGDLKDKVIRFVGNPLERIREDPLRILRAVRIASKLQFKIEENSLRTLVMHKYMLDEVSWERRRDELLKIAKTPRFHEFIRILYSTRVYEHVIPELSNIDIERVVAELERADRKRFNYMVKLAVLYYNIYRRIIDYTKDDRRALNIVENSLNRLKLSKREQRIISSLAGAIEKIESMSKDSVLKIGREAYRLLRENGVLLLEAVYSITGDKRYFDARKIVEYIGTKHTHPLITGEEILVIYGYPEPGPWVGVVKEKLYSLQLERDIDSVNELIGLALGKIIPVHVFERFLKRVVDGVRELYGEEIETYMQGGIPEKDCIEINSIIVKELEKIGLKARLVRLPSLKHWVVELALGKTRYYLDAVPEFSRTINRRLYGIPLIITAKNIYDLDDIYLEDNEKNTQTI